MNRFMLLPIHSGTTILTDIQFLLDCLSMRTNGYKIDGITFSSEWMQRPSSLISSDT